MKIRIPLLAMLIGTAIGLLTGGLIGGVKGFVYALAIAVVADILSLLPIAGPLITWFWIMPLFKKAIGVGAEMIVVDVITIIPSIIVNAVVTMVLLLFIIDLVRS